MDTILERSQRVMKFNLLMYVWVIWNSVAASNHSFTIFLREPLDHLTDDFTQVLNGALDRQRPLRSIESDEVPVLICG